MPSAHQADIAVIGGGIIGMSCAYELARQSDAQIVVFDKQPIGGGTTGGSAGVICLHDMGALYAQLTLLGFARVTALSREHEFGFTPWGMLDVCYGDRAWPPPPNPYAARFGGGATSIYDHAVLDTATLLERYPWIKPAHVRGGVLYHNQGFVDPYRLTQLYEQLALATGRVTVQRTTPVLQMRRTSERVTTLVTRRGAWHVGQVLNAAGPWGAKVAALAGSALPLTPQRIQVCVATGFDDGVDTAPLTSVPESVDGEGVWCRGELGGTLLFGQHHHTVQEAFTTDPDYVNRVNDPGYPAAVETVYRRYWHLPQSVFLNGWCCVYGSTADGFPIISRDTECTNLYHAVGLNGHGITCHAGVALATAGLLLRGETQVDLVPHTGHHETLDISVLAMDRFARGAPLDFVLRDAP